jgi:predicted nucleic acid-binding protein
VVLKWFVEEEYSREARRLLQAFREGAVGLNTSPILTYELGNAFWVLTYRRRKMDEEYAREAYGRLLGLPLKVVQLGPQDLKEALQLAGELALVYYDVLYLVSARKSGGTLVSVDQELISKGGRYVDVSHLKEVVV